MLYVVSTERIDPLFTFIEVCFYKTILAFLGSSYTTGVDIISVLISLCLSTNGFNVLYLGVNDLQVNEVPNKFTLYTKDCLGNVLSVTTFEILKFWD